MDGKALKRQRINPRENQKNKVAELEEFLFGSKGAAAQLFEQSADVEEDGDDTPLGIADLIHRVGLSERDNDAPLFFEDRSGVKQRKAAATPSAAPTASADDDDDGDAPEEAPSKRGTSDAAMAVSIRQSRALSGRQEPGASASADARLGRASRRRAAGEPFGFGSDGDSGGSDAAAGVDGPATADASDDDEAALASSASEQDEGGAEESSATTNGRHTVTAKRRMGSGLADAAAVDPRDTAAARGGVASTSGRTAVWSDPADQALRVDVARNSRMRKLRTSEKQTVMDGAQYESALRKQHKILNPRTSWASAKRKDAAAAARKAGTAAGYGSDSADSDAADDVAKLSDEARLLQTAGGLVGPRSSRLPSGNIEATRLKDANVHEPSAAVVQSVRFHPNAQLLLTAGLDKKLRLFQVDGLRNPKVQAVHFDDMPIHSAAFAGPGGSKVLLSGRRPHCYLYDLAANKIERLPGPTGRCMKSLESFAVSPAGASGEPLAAFAGDQGYVPLLSLRSRQWVGELKMSGSARSMAFSPDGNQLLTSGGDGVVCTWDLRMRRCLHSMLDAGNAGSGGGSALALSPDNRFIATGSDSGVVNVYRHSQVVKAPRSFGHMSLPPVKELMNLTTTVDTLTFSPDAQILAIASRMSKDALRLVHLPSLSVFANWPTSRSPLHYVHSLDFSPGCGFLAIGNAKGRVLLYRLHHYNQA